MGIHQGVGLRCLQCGEGRRFRRFLKASERCDTCGADNSVYPSDDALPT
jgi:uncharacterized protein (DUF983 family)